MEADQWITAAFLTTVIAWTTFQLLRPALRFTWALLAAITEELWLFAVGEWQLMKERRAVKEKLLASQRQLARMLHTSSAWHCGCRGCRAARETNHGDVPKLGVVTARNALGVESVWMTEEEKRRL